MNTTALQHIESTFNTTALYAALLVVSYALLALLVYRTQVFAGLSPTVKEAIHKLSTVVLFGALGFYML